MLFLASNSDVSDDSLTGEIQDSQNRVYQAVIWSKLEPCNCQNNEIISCQSGLV